MTVYMVFEPPRRDDDAVTHAERIVFVREGFSWLAFLFAPLWMLWHRLWLVLAAYVVVSVALIVGLRFLGVDAVIRDFVVHVLLGLLVGFEAATLRRWTLLRRGWQDRGIVIGDDRDAAERRFFDRYVMTETTREMEAALAAPPPPPPPPGASDVVGLFPQPGTQPGAPA